VDALEEWFSELAHSVAAFEVEEGAEWKVDFFSLIEPKQADISDRMADFAACLNIALPRFEIHTITSQDWVQEVQQRFPPLRIGRFFVHGSFYHGALPPSAIGLQVDAGMAFGSGEHETTTGCLLALEYLAKRGVVRNPVLDMGAGSGILAMAAAKRCKSKVLATDIDPPSVRIAAENVRDNLLARFIRSVWVDSFRRRAVSQEGPYGLIFANILARPLVGMSRGLALHTAPGGYVILSGLLRRQERYVLAAYRRQGLKLVRRFPLGNWVTLLLKRGS
jgi:ribosomal protein L11 methyltransferase